jgi:cell division septum initiation protein DivIVA
VASGERLELEPGQTGGELTASLEHGEDTERVASEIGVVSFPLSFRGYERRAVDAYVHRVQQWVAELEPTRSPEAAVKHALERVGEQTKGILERAGETAEQITVAARREAEATTAGAKGEADEIVAKAKVEESELLARTNAEAEATLAHARAEATEQLQRCREEIAALREEAEAQLRELEADTEAIRQQRSQLLTDIRQIATRIEQAAGAADARFPPPDTTGPAEEAIKQPAATGEANATNDTATDVSTAETGTRRPSPT